MESIMPKTKTKPRVRAKGVRSASHIKVRYTFKVEGELNISPYVAQRTVNGYLLMRVANLIGAGEPELQLRPKGAFWIVPVILTIPKVGHLGPLGHIVVDAQNGSILEEESTPCEEIEKEADRLAPEETL
jgi:hypothetical protein